MPQVISLVIRILGQIAGVVVHHLMTRIGITWVIYLYKVISRMFAETEATSDGTYGVSGDKIRVETGKEYKKDGNGDFQLERSWTFNFDENFNMLGGIETRSDGTEVTFGANWIIQGEKVSLSSLTEIRNLDEVLSSETGVKLSDLFDFVIAGDSTTTATLQRNAWIGVMAPKLHTIMKMAKSLGEKTYSQNRWKTPVF